MRFDDHPSTVAALAFTPGRRRLRAAAHYGGVTLHVLDRGACRFPRKGSMVAVTVSPDGRFVVAGAQDREVVVWPIEGGEPMEMSGYGGKPVSLSWSDDGGHLATSGADGVIVWPFAGRRGPFGQRPLELAPERKALVTAVAFHPRARRIAFGYRDGFSAVTGFSGAPEIVAEADGEAVTALAWSADGLKLAACARQRAGGGADLGEAEAGAAQAVVGVIASRAAIRSRSVVTVETSATPSTLAGRKWRWKAATTASVVSSKVPVRSTP